MSEAQQRDIIAWLNEVYANEKVELDPALAVLQWASLSTRTVVMTRGEIWWATLRDPGASEPGYRRPVLLVQSDAFNQSAIRTFIVAAISSNFRLATALSNVMLRKRESRLAKDSIVRFSASDAKEGFSSPPRGENSAGASPRGRGGLRLVLSL